MTDEHLVRTRKLRELITQYGAMKQLDGYTRQSRGIAFNKLIAEMLGCYGIPAKFSVRGEGEIDVAFAINGFRYVLEAKWRSGKVTSGDIAKLNMRVEQRFVTTIGVFVAVEGYSPNALRAVNIGRRMLMLLLNKQHIEAILAGLVDPAEFFDLLIDKLSYEGGILYEIEDLFGRPQKAPQIRFDVPATLRDAVRKTAPGVCVDVIIHDLPFGYSGLACDAQGKLLLNLPEGVAKVDVDSERASWAVPLPGCSNHVLSRESRIYFRRRLGIGYWDNGKLKAIDGGFSGDAILLATDSGDALALDTGGVVPTEGTQVAIGEGVGIVWLGESLGKSRHVPTMIRGAYLGDAVWAAPQTIVAIGGSSMEIIDAESGQSEGHAHRYINTFSIEKCDSSHFLTVADGQTLIMISLDGKTAQPIADFGFNQGGVSELRKSIDGYYYMYSTYSPKPGLLKGAVARAVVPLSASGRTAPPLRQ